MGTSVRAFRLGAAACGASAVAPIAIECAFFRGPDVPFVRVFSLVAGIGLLFCAAVVGGSALWLQSFRFDYRGSGVTEETRKRELIKMARVPLRFFALYLVFFLVYLAFLRVFAARIGLYPGLETPILLICLAWGLLGAGCAFNLSDLLGIKYILSQKIDEYPRSLRERRQQTKTVVFPLYTLALGLIYALALGLFLLGKWKSVENIPLFSCVSTGFGILCFITFAYFQLLLRSRNLALVFDSVLSQLDQLSSDEKNLANRIHVGSVDELASIAGLVNEFTAGLAASVGDLKAVETELGSLGTELQRNAEGSSAAVQTIAQNMERMRERSAAQASSVQGVTTAVHRIAGNVAALDTLVTDQAASVTEASSSIEEMVGNINSINNSMGIMARQFKELADTARAGTATQETSVRRIDEIAENSKALQEANRVIASIASQTNLLAMNAAIEAAHAGAAGMGFAVVADEIRKLAENAAKNSKTINVVLKEVESGIASVVEASRASTDSFNLVAEMIGSTDAIVQEFKMAIGEQHEGAKQILEALRQMNEITAQVKTGSSEMTEGSGTIVREVSALRSNSEGISESARAVGEGIAAVKGEVARVSALAGTARAAIARLEEAIGGFKV